MVNKNIDDPTVEVKEKNGPKKLSNLRPERDAASVEEEKILTSEYSKRDLTDDEKKASQELFDDFDKYLRKECKDYSLSKDNLTTIPTGIDVFDCILGGGVATGLIQFVGPPGCGKSSLAAKVVATGQRKWPGKFISIYLDAENTTTTSRLEELGVKNPKITPQRGITVEKVFSIIEHLCVYKEKRNDLLDVPSLVVWDSIAMTPTEAEATSESEQLSQLASAMTKYLKKYVDKMAFYNITLLAVNQLRDNMSIGPIKQFNKLKFLGDYKIPGGNANLFASTQLFFCRPTGDIRSENDKGNALVLGFDGSVVTGKTVKNKMFSPNIPIELAFSFEHGFSNFWTNYLLLKNTNRITGSAWKSLQGFEEKKFNTREAINLYRTNEKFAKVWDASVEDVLNTEFKNRYAKTSENIIEVW